MFFNSITYVKFCAIWYHLYNLKNVKNTRNFTESNTPPWVFFSRFSYCTNGTKSRNASHILSESRIYLLSLCWIFWNIIFHENGDKEKYEKFNVYLRLWTPEQLIMKHEIFLCTTGIWIHLLPSESLFLVKKWF